MNKAKKCGDCTYFMKVNKNDMLFNVKDIGECLEPTKTDKYLVNKHNRSICGFFFPYNEDLETGEVYE